jgi:hypothetical protein
MTRLSAGNTPFACFLLLAIANGCGNEGSSGAGTTDGSDTDGESDTTDGDGTSGTDAAEELDAAVDPGADSGGECNIPQGPGMRPDMFPTDALAGPIVEVACTLDDGTASTCYEVRIAGRPSNHDTGPFCPRNIADGDDVGGIWIESGEVYPISGAFIAGLAEFYNDDTWQLYDPETGAIRVTETEEACTAAARPNVAAEYNNYCVECLIEWVDGGIVATFTIPRVPVARDNPAELAAMNDVGVALNGVAFAPPAPVQAILAAHTIAAFDDCGGHVNPNAGYHYHAATGCSIEEAECDGHAALLGYALDGYAIHAMTDSAGVEPGDLDECRGHTDPVRGYHYHSASAGENMFIGCFHGRIASTAGGGDVPGGPGGGGAPGACVDENATMCCGDGVCDGPETAASCAADCR